MGRSVFFRLSDLSSHLSVGISQLHSMECLRRVERRGRRSCCKSYANHVADIITNESRIRCKPNALDWVRTEEILYTFELIN